MLDELLKLYEEYRASKDEETKRKLKNKMLNIYFRARRRHINLMKNISKVLRSKGIRSQYWWDDTYNVPVTLVKLSSFIAFVEQQLKISVGLTLSVVYRDDSIVMYPTKSESTNLCIALERVCEILLNHNIKSTYAECRLVIKLADLLEAVKQNLEEDVRDIIAMTYDAELDALMIHTVMDPLLKEIYDTIISK